MKKLAILGAGALAAVSAFAQITGDWGKAMHMGGMSGGTTFSMIIGVVFSIGLTLLVWLWVFKLWRELGHKRK